MPTSAKHTGGKLILAQLVVDAMQKNPDFGVTVLELVFAFGQDHRTRGRDLSALLSIIPEVPEKEAGVCDCCGKVFHMQEG